jgi:hypothetical protein
MDPLEPTLAPLNFCLLDMLVLLKVKLLLLVLLLFRHLCTGFYSHYFSISEIN